MMEKCFETTEMYSCLEEALLHMYSTYTYILPLQSYVIMGTFLPGNLFTVIMKN